MTNKKKTVALCTSRIFDIQNHAFIRKLNESLKEDGIRLLVYAINSDLYWEEDNDNTEAFVFELIPMWKIDALIYMDEKIKSHKVARHVIDRAKSYNVPVLVVDGSYEGCPSVSFDFESGFESIVRHIIEEHHVRRPHFMAGIRNNPFSDQRIEIFKKVLSENGMEFSEDMLSYGEFWAIPARKAMTEALDKGLRPDAVICANDYMAINVIEVLKDRGFKVPEEVIVSGFDGVDEAWLCEPTVTTGDCNTVALAAEVARTVKRMLVSDISDSAYKVMPRLLKGESCGCADCAYTDISILDMVNDKSYRYQDDISQFYEMTMRMQMSTTPDEMASGIYGDKLSEMFCVVNNLCFKRDVDYFKPGLDVSYPTGLSLLYETGAEHGIREVEGEQMIELAERKMDTGYPLIFNVLHYMKKPLGYVCFTFSGYDISEYAKTSSISNYLSLGLGGFINMRYQQYLFEKLENMYKYDHLTGLYNRQGFTNALAKLKEDLKDDKKPLTVIMADLDGLKYINDTFGHSAGDNAIAVTAAALKEACPEGALCLRFGGDEMLAFVVGGCRTDGILQSIKNKLDEYNASSGLEYEVHASCGEYQTVLDKNSDMEELVKKADMAMYENKRVSKRESEGV